MHLLCIYEFIIVFYLKKLRKQQGERKIKRDSRKKDRDNTENKSVIKEERGIKDVLSVVFSISQTRLTPRPLKCYKRIKASN